MTRSTPSQFGFRNIIPASHDNDVITVADRGHIHAELAETAERNTCNFLSDIQFRFQQ